MTYNVKDCDPTLLDNNTIMTGDNEFIRGKEDAERVCMKLQCENIQQCLTVADLLRQHKYDKARELFEGLMDSNK